MPDTDTDEPLHANIECIKHPANLAIQALPKDNAKVSRCDWLNMLNPCTFAIEDNSFQQLRREHCIPHSIEEHFVFLVDLVAGMGQVLGKVTVIREKNESLSLHVEPADIEQARKFWREQIKNCVARMRIVSRGNKARRLVQDDGERWIEMHKFAIDFDMIAGRRLGAEICANGAVNRDAPRCDQFIALPPRSNARGSKKTIEAHSANVIRDP